MSAISSREAQHQTTDMAPSKENVTSLQARLGQALKTTARDVLALLFVTKFALIHAGEKPYDVLMKTKGKSKLKENPQMARAIQSGEEEKLDISALGLLLQHCCGLSTKPTHWKNTNKLEGNVSEIRSLRNEDGHWTEGSATAASVEKSWARLEKAVVGVLEKGDLKSHVPKFKEQLERDKKPPRKSYASPKRSNAAVTVWKETRDFMRNELRENFSSGVKTTQMPLVWGGKNFSFHHKVASTYTSSKFSFLRDDSPVNVESDGVVEARGPLKAMVVQGESGTGKTSLLRYYASLWSASPCPLPSLAAFDLLLFLDCNAVTTKTFRVCDILQEILPKSNSKWKPVTLRKSLTHAGSSVMIMIDAFDERLEAFQRAFQELQTTCPEAFFLITTRPHCVPAIGRLCEREVLYVTAHGFSRPNARSYTSKLLQMQEVQKDPDELLQLLSKHEQLVTIPQLLCWCTYFWMEKGAEHFSTLGRIFFNVTEFILKKMCYINGKRVLSGELPQEGKQWLSKVAEVAFRQRRPGRSSLPECCEDVKKLYLEAKKLGLLPRSAVSSLMQCDESHMTGGGESITFHFLHTSHANFLVAYHIFEILRTDKKATVSKLLAGFKEDEKAILPFVVSLLFLQGEEHVELARLQEIAAVAKRFVRFFDINYFLTLIEESGHSEALAKELAKNMPQDTTVDPLGAKFRNGTGMKSQLSGMTTSGVPPPPSGHLWIRKKELNHNKSLSLLLSHALPARLWLRLSDGNQPAESLRDDTNSALRLIKNAYGKNTLCDLRLSGVASSVPLPWPKNLWWLTIEQGKLKGDLGLQKGLRKLTFCECSGIEKVRIPVSVTSMALQSMEVEELTVPENLKALTVSGCNINKLSVKSNDLQTVRLIDCKADNTNLPVSLSLQRQISETLEDSQTRSR